MKIGIPALCKTLRSFIGEPIPSRSSRVHRLLLSILMLAFVASPRVATCTQFVTYTFSGELASSAPPPDDELTFDGLVVSGHVTFYARADLLPPERGLHEWHEYVPSARIRLNVGEATLSNVENGSACWVWMRIGQPWIRFWCRPFKQGSHDLKLMLNFEIHWPYDNSLYELPYPEGPFSPENFRDRDISGGLFLETYNRTYGASLDLLNVQFISEPSQSSLILIAGLTLALFCRRCGNPPLPTSTECS